MLERGAHGEIRRGIMKIEDREATQGMANPNGRPALAPGSSARRHDPGGLDQDQYRRRGRYGMRSSGHMAQDQGHAHANDGMVCTRHVQWQAYEGARVVRTRRWESECRMRPGRTVDALQCTADDDEGGMAKEWQMMCAITGRSDGALDAWDGDVRVARSAMACWHTSTGHSGDGCCDGRSVAANVQGHTRCIEGRVETRARVLRLPLSPLTTHHSPLTTHHSPLTTHHSPLTTHHSPLTTHLSPLISRLSPLTSLLSLLCRRASSSTH